MNILVTGASGFIGTHLIESLEKHHRIFKLDRKDRSEANYFSADLGQIEKLKEDFKSKHLRIDVIIHTASRLITSGTDSLDVFYSNLKITEGLVELAKILKPKKIINFSSIAVYPNLDGDYKENSEIRPSTNAECLYGLSKFCSENILDSMLKDQNIIITNLRIAQTYGEGMRKDRILSIFLDELKRKNSITVFGGGERISNFIEIKKLVKVITFFVENDAAGIFNVGDKNISYLKMAERIISSDGNKGSKIIKKKNGSTAKFYLDTSKLKLALKDEIKNIL